MRKLLALAMVAVLALFVAFSVMGCAQQAQEPVEETPTDMGTDAMPDTMMDSTVVDTMSH